VGSVAAMAAAKGVFAAIWIASSAAWCGNRVVGGVVMKVLVGVAGRESWETGIERVDEGQVFWMLRSVFGWSDMEWSKMLFVCMV
jgi:hypothetical protein